MAGHQAATCFFGFGRSQTNRGQRRLRKLFAIRLLVYAARQLRRHPAEVQLRHGARPRTKRRMQLKILQGLPGIGSARAQQLLEHFGSVEAVMTASAEQLEGLPGFGEKTSARMRWALEA